MVKYAQSELFSVTDFAKQLGSVVKSIKEQSIEKIGILKNNKLEAVVISTVEYEKLKALEESVELAEHVEIYNIVKERRKTPLSEYISMEEMFEKVENQRSKC